MTIKAAKDIEMLSATKTIFVLIDLCRLKTFVRKVFKIFDLKKGN